MAAARGWRDRIAAGATVLALIVAVAAFLWLAFWPYAYRGEVVEEAAGGVQRRYMVHASMVQMNGWGVLPALLAPVVLTTSSVAAGAVYRRRGGWGRWIIGGTSLVMWVFSCLTVFSIGLFYVPVAVLLTVAALLMPQVPI